jgi:hypothetical protein
MSTLRQLLEVDRAGDPMAKRGIWTALRLRKIAEQLRRLGLVICPNTVRRLLEKLGYALYSNRKSLCSRNPDRDRQFRCLARQRRRFTRQHAPVISVDTKKRELVGRFKNGGRAWSRAPVAVQDHDFPSLAKGVAIPYGIYDCQANYGSVVVGTSRNTADFAVDAICQWWRRQGSRRYGGASQILILADSGGSNGATCHQWKYALQAKLADPYGLSVTVCHYPTGASKWNPIEHRLFSEISKQWAGLPLTDYPTVLRLIRGTNTTTGLKVAASLNPKKYPTGVKITPQQMRELSLYKHSVLPKWNYTLLPRQNRN